MVANQGISIVVAHDEGLSSGWVASHIPPDAGISISAVVSTLSSTSEDMLTSDADMLVVAVGAEDEEALDLIEWWVDHRNDHPVVVVCHSSANGFVKRAFDAGADDLVMLEIGGEISAAASQQLVFAIEKAAARKRTPAVPPTDLAPLVATHNGAVICVLGPKGGIGKTVTSSNLAARLAEQGKKVVLLDFDLQFGDVALSLGLRPENTVYDLATSGGSLDAEKIDAYLMRHATGLRVLAAPLRPDQAGSVSAEFLVEVINALRTVFQFVIIDTPPAFTPEVIGAIDASTNLCMIGMLDALSLKNTRLGLETLELMGYPAERIRVVLNRANTNVGITGNDVQRVLGRPPDILVPSHRDVARSINTGEPIVLAQKRSDAGRAFSALAASFIETGPRTARRGFRIGMRRRND
jgi:pilus assembly protein CpaE